MFNFRLTHFAVNAPGDLLESYVRQTLMIVMATHVEIMLHVRTLSLTSIATAYLVLWERHVRLMLMTVPDHLVTMVAHVVTM